MKRMAGKYAFSSWQALSALALGALAVEFGCAVEKDAASEAGIESAEEQDEALIGMLEDTWPTAIEPALNSADASIAALQTATVAWAADSGSETARTAAQDAWIEAMRAWQALEVMQVGPAGSSLTALGGENIRDSIYSWPTTNPCRVDQVTCRFEFEDGDFFEDALVNAYGLDALETVLFSAPNENSCSSNSGINREDTWDDVGAEGIAQARADYADLMAGKIASDLQRIRHAWESSFDTELATAGQGSEAFDSSVKGVNAIYDGLFYLETYVKDRKLGWPLGIRDCGQEDCSGEVESLMAGLSNEWLAANLNGFRALYTGGEGTGLVDLLISVDEEELANDVLTRLDEADVAVAALSSDINETLSSDPDTVEAAHAAIKEVTDLLKVDIATVLSLEVPSEAAGDND
jgi:predicted lipoprotein